MYVTNQTDIVNHAKYCYANYPTIVNNVPKDKTVYSNTMDDFAKVDNLLSASQTDIGESSNLAQIAQTYACTYNAPIYDDYVAILSIIAQIAIDSSKRVYDVNTTEIIRDAKSDMGIKYFKYPMFWGVIKKGFNKSNINKDLKCPMNYLCDLKLDKIRCNESTLPMSYFFEKFDTEVARKTCRRVEELISSYSFNLSKTTDDSLERDDYILMRSDFEKLVKDIQATNISGNYVGLFSWLIDRAFMITPEIKRNHNQMKSLIAKNKSLFMKVLYDVNKKNLLKCFSKNLKN